MIGQIIANRYKIIKFLARGGFGETYIAEDTQLPGHPQCVLKHLNPISTDPQNLKIARRLFNQEAKILHELGEHPNIPRLLAFLEENQEFYLVQELINGHPLSRELSSGQRWTEAKIREMLIEVLKILVFVHQHKVIHRDIKPDNLMRRHSDEQLVLIDFGAIKQKWQQASSTTQGGTNLTIAIGTPGYMPIEQAGGQPHTNSDLYALGMVAIQALTGIYPGNLSKDPNTREILWQHLVPVSDFLKMILTKMTRYNLCDRYQTAEETLQALTGQPSAPPPSAAPSAPPPPPQPPTGSPQTQVVIAPSPTRRNFVKWIGVGIVGSLIIKSIIGENERPKGPIPPKPISTFPFEVITVDARGQKINSRQEQAEFFRENLGSGTTLEMVKIPSDKFKMGSPRDEKDRYDNEEAQHDVTVESFYLGKCAVTQAQWRAVAKLPKINIDLNPYPSYFKGENLPVEQVNWDESGEFCARLSKQTGKNYRLPTEAEWEYACRAGTTTPFHFGETITSKLANYNASYTYANEVKGEYLGQTTEVGNFPPNGFGLYDLHGNVWEWCADFWHENYQGAPTDGSAWNTNRNNSQHRVVRGGSWNDNPRNCRSACRNYYGPGDRYRSIGFRVVCSVGWNS